MLRRHFIINSGNSTSIINGGLPKDIPNNTIYYWTTESVEEINNNDILTSFTCYDSNNAKLEIVSNIITNNVGIITMSGDIARFQFPFYGNTDKILDVRYIQLPKSCLGGIALAYNLNLQELYIDDQIININVTIFPYIAFTPNLHIIKVDKYNLKYDSRDNCNAIIETETNTLIVGCQNTIIPNTITSIGFGAFYGNTNLYTINIPDSINNIGSNAFEHCGLTSITLPINISIKAKVFMNCLNLTEINYKGTMEQWHNIIKNDKWNEGSSITVVHCTDGDVEIQ